MKRSWCRLYAEFAFDPKVQSMSEAMQRRFIMLMCLKCNGDETLHETELAYALRVTEQELAETKTLFKAKLFIDDSWNLLNWEERQYISDSSTSRVKKYREKKLKQPCNVSVTPPDTDTDNKITTIVVTKKPSKRDLVPIAEVTLAMVKDWADTNIPKTINLDRELLKFKTHEYRGKQPTDGVRAFQKWLLKSLEFADAEKQKSASRKAFDPWKN